MQTMAPAKQAPVCRCYFFFFTVTLLRIKTAPLRLKQGCIDPNISTLKSALTNDHLRILLQPQTLFMGFRLQEDVSDFGVGHLGIYTVEASERSGE